jgi:hypothetical protein
MKQVYQELPFPRFLSEDEYLGPYSALNTRGDPRKSYALFKLVDPISSFSSKYLPTAASFSQSYKTMIRRIDPHCTAERILANAIKKIETEKFAALGPYTQSFYLIETFPYDLFKEKPRQISFTVGPQDSDADFVKIGSEQIQHISLFGFMAYINRPWFSPAVFGKSKWTIKGCKMGTYSDGTYFNTGLIPLIPVSLIISMEDNNRYVVGMISDIVPLTPVTIEVDPLQNNTNSMLRSRADLKKQTIPILVDEFGDPIL